VELFVATSAPKADFFAKLADVYPAGRAYHVSDGILRQDYGAPSSLDEVHCFGIMHSSSRMVSKQGHRIRLDITSSNYPRHDRNPNTGRNIASETAPRLAKQTVFHDQFRQSRLTVPMLLGTESRPS